MVWNGESGWAAGPGPPLLTDVKEDVVGPCLAPPAPSVSAWVLLCLLLKASAHPQRQERLRQPPFTHIFSAENSSEGLEGQGTDGEIPHQLPSRTEPGFKHPKQTRAAFPSPFPPPAAPRVL